MVASCYPPAWGIGGEGALTLACRISPPEMRK